MKFNLRYIYVFTIFTALLSSLYSLFVPGISKPTFPSENMKESLLQLTSRKLISVKTFQSTSDSADRKLSSIHLYHYSDGLNILATIVRVRKRDDFKIETYGLLTKGIPELYIKNPRSTNSVPYSIYGLLGNRDSLQTCIVPGTTKIEQVDIRLGSLTAAVQSMDTTKSNLLTKLLGTEKVHDYSCLVLTFQASTLSSPLERSKTWVSIIELAQMALAR
jgi:hypothetical protein